MAAILPIKILKQLHLILINLNLNSHMWLVTTKLGSVVLDTCIDFLNANGHSMHFSIRPPSSLPYIQDISLAKAMINLILSDVSWYSLHASCSR